MFYYYLEQAEKLRKKLYYSFKCTDADEDGVFSDGTCPFGEIDTNEFATIVHEFETSKSLTLKEFNDNYLLPKFDPLRIELRQREPEFKIYSKGDYIMIHDDDIHYFYNT